MAFKFKNPWATDNPWQGNPWAEPEEMGKALGEYKPNQIKKSQYISLKLRTPGLSFSKLPTTWEPFFIPSLSEVKKTFNNGDLASTVILATHGHGSELGSTTPAFNVEAESATFNGFNELSAQDIGCYAVNGFMDNKSLQKHLDGLIFLLEKTPWGGTLFISGCGSGSGDMPSAIATLLSVSTPNKKLTIYVNRASSITEIGNNEHLNLNIGLAEYRHKENPLSSLYDLQKYYALNPYKDTIVKIQSSGIPHLGLSPIVTPLSGWLYASETGKLIELS